MIKQIRYKFPETNSSSSHAIAVSTTNIDKDLTLEKFKDFSSLSIEDFSIDVNEKKIYLEKYVEFNQELTSYNEDYIGKALYCLGLAWNLTSDDKVIKEQEERICKIFKDFTGYDLILKWRLDADYEDTVEGAPSIDHQSSFNVYLLKFSDDDIKNFIFSPDSVLITSGDDKSSSEIYSYGCQNEDDSDILIVFYYNKYVDYQSSNESKDDEDKYTIVRSKYKSEVLFDYFLKSRILEKEDVTVTKDEDGSELLTDLGKIFKYFCYYRSLYHEERKVSEFYVDKRTKKLITLPYECAFSDISNYNLFRCALTVIDISNFSIYDLYISNELSDEINLWSIADYPIIQKIVNSLLVPAIKSYLDRPAKYYKDYYLSNNIEILYVSNEVFQLLKEKFINKIYFSRIKIYDKTLGFLY